ncbi:eukaryotic translation initiation factor 3 [Fusarium beomiforme]|uniref:Eukaryotic translation initiation factor 3 n=1 Tax=Fusarium beomiforme TaxID=44412 RepID=A0A9P5DWV5_9HYPO|nr:eukaryotic translation initiation factor 3 [Fusarium beomiforme]
MVNQAAHSSFNSYTFQMPLQSKRSVKVHEIPVGTTEDQYLEFVKHLCTRPKKSSGFHLSRFSRHLKGKAKTKKPTKQSNEDEEPSPKSKDERNPSSALRNEAGPAEPLLENQGEISQVSEKVFTGTTFCLQNGQPVGTVPFSSEAFKKETMARHDRDKNLRWKDWIVEDNFKGITILYEGTDAMVDICAVHGLGGNAIDTWTAENGQLWLRDFLPAYEHTKTNFKKSRIMTFGYDSDLTDRSTVMELENWAETLLLSLNEVRTSEKEDWSYEGPWHGSILHPIIVTQASATLGKDQAFMIMDVDHSSICKFKSRLGAFVTINMALFEVFSDVTTGGVQQPVVREQRRMFGQPRFLAHAYPPDRGFWWEGNELHDIQHQLTSTKPFFGRSKEFEALETSLTGDALQPKLTVVKGIAGIGKTELLLQFAAKQRGHRNVFFLTSYDKEPIQSVLSKLSTKIGFDMIDNPAVNQERWRSTPVSERIQIFTAWLGDACNKESLFIIDDIEAFGYSSIPTILKYPAHHALVSTRDSNLVRTDRDFRELRLSPLNSGDTTRFLKRTLDNLSSNSASWNGLDSIARIVQGHPLAARNAIPFIWEYLSTYDSPSGAFLDLLNSQDPDERKLFFHFSFEGRSLWDAFNTSLERLELQDNPDNAAKLIQILPFLCFSKDCVDDLLKMNKRWLRDWEDELPDIAILKSGYPIVSHWLSKLRGVSFYIWGDSFSTTKALNIHPLISQYMLLHMDEQTRISLMRQVLQLCYGIESRGADRETQVKPHVLQCLQVCQGLGVPLNSLGLPLHTMQWAETFQGRHEQVEEVEGTEENPFVDPIESLASAVDEFITKTLEAKERLQGGGVLMPDETTTYTMLRECKRAYKRLCSCFEAREGVTNSINPDLKDAITALQEMVRLRNMYPEFISELEEFKKALDNCS